MRHSARVFFGGSCVGPVAGALIGVSSWVVYGARDHSNGTRTFHNDTKTLTGETLFDLTKQEFNITYQTGIMGTEVISINNVSKQGSFAWIHWIWNSTGRSRSLVWENAE
jgi:hypothetical protein